MTATIDFATLSLLRSNHPAWRLLLADHAPLVISFLHRVFIAPNIRVMAEDELAARLEDELFHLRQAEGDEIFPRSAGEYLNDWAANDRGWLRKFYPPGSDEPHFDLTPAVEKTVTWLQGLLQRSFVGTESRLLTVFELLRQMVTGAETNAETRIAELEREKIDLDRQIARIRSGDLPILDDTALKERFHQLSGLARELLGDFREVEHNFRQLDQSVREQIATWEGGKGELLARIFGERDSIADSDQGKSFHAFWDFLMSPDRQEELSGLLEKVFTLEAIATLHADTRLKRIHYDWLEAGEHTQRTVARLSHQLRRYLDNQAWLENKRIMQLLQAIEVSALTVRDRLPTGNFMEIAEPSPTLSLPMDRPLYAPPIKPVINARVLAGGEDDIPADALFEQVTIDKAALKANIRRFLQTRGQITLREVVEENPLQHGLAELITYLALATDDRQALFDDSRPERISWQNAAGEHRCATLPRVIFSRLASSR